MDPSNKKNGHAPSLPDTPDLLDTAGNPAPAGVSLAWIATADGLRLRAAVWRPDGSARGTVTILQGRAEFIEKYHEVVSELLARGFAVVAFDWRGQGASGRSVADGHKGHVERFEDFRHDVEAVADAILPGMPRPVIGLAHSMGGCIALTAAAEGWLPTDRLVAAAPMIGLSVVKRPALIRALALVLSLVGLGRRSVPGGELRSISLLPFAGNRLCGDPVRYARNAALAGALGTAAIGAPTIGWLDAAFRAMARLRARDYAARIAMPTLMVAAGADPVCSTPAIELFARGLPAGSLVVIPGARHEILMESDAIRDRFWAAFDAFVHDLPAAVADLPVQPVERDRMEARIAAGNDRAASSG